jgi:hypothetical protein
VTAPGRRRRTHCLSLDRARSRDKQWICISCFASLLQAELHQVTIRY